MNNTSRATQLRAARRPKPKSQVEEALEAVQRLWEGSPDADPIVRIRRALRRLQQLEGTSTSLELPVETSVKAASAYDRFLKVAAKLNLGPAGIRYVEHTTNGDYEKAIELLTAKSDTQIEELNAKVDAR